jgi:hypothetical protein
LIPSVSPLSIPNPAEPEPNIAYRLAKLSDGSGSAEPFGNLKSAPKLKRQQIIMNKGSARRSENILAETARILLHRY